MKAIAEFYAAADKLRKLKVVRSDRYLGDIAEFIAKSSLGMELAENCREKGYDGLINNRKVEVKYNGGKSITVNAGKPETYDELIIILGPRSVMRLPELSDEYVIYRIPSSYVSQKSPHKDGIIRFAKGDLKEKYRVAFDCA
ncbi:TPA: hypothetical protein ACMDOR_003550 [Vibrio parahaemolyticus]|nr:hypothetical protein [Vibrio parahaemolyticus]EGR2834679.1 hypothetical protein [Vibrio parahaemolyticus]EGR2941289.1 hypothetical protein [Vibrio parahaemolyticus]EGR3020050.1 hypothetical protein [Vibrio parahaemolyticus]KIT25005.1 hypothetical protein H323_08050 [Vibrio parahaemolyticus VP766]